MPPIWTQRSPVARLLWPLSLLYRALFALRGLLYRWGLLRAYRSPVPVVVVGNVVAGGGGKTPTLIAILRHLQARSLRVGVVSRGYGRQTQGLQEVSTHSRAQDVGDEPLLIFKAFQAHAGTNRTQVAPVFVANQRAQAVQALLAKHPQVQVVLSDDGLQHLALARNVEVVVFGDAGLGNGWLLPAGPLREPWPRQSDSREPWARDSNSRESGPRDSSSREPGPRAAELVLNTGSQAMGGHQATRQLATYALRADGTLVPLQSLQGPQAAPLVAVAGIARPESFFTMLQATGLQPEQFIALPDHYHFDSWQANEHDGKQLICTEKDAVKLWQHVPTALAVPLLLTPEPAFFQALDDCLARALSPSQH
jgi:tetraacyldisaccharide 4'-kinase